MNWQVTSSIHGGQQYAPATQQEYESTASALLDEAQNLAQLSSSWQSAALQLQYHRSSAPFCPVMSGSAYTPNVSGIAQNGMGQTSSHVSLPYSRLIAQCNEHARECTRLGQDLTEMAQALIRAHALYSFAETMTHNLVEKTLDASSSWSPLGVLMLGGAAALGGFAVGSVQEGAPNAMYASDTVSWMYEGFLSGVASRITKNFKFGYVADDEVNRAASRIAIGSKVYKDLKQGNHLRIREVHANTDVVRSTHSVASGMENLRRLAEERLGKIELNSGLSYATIAIQRYRRADGSDGWLVLVPGTDGEDDSPFGWAQNVELMSDNPIQRKQADSLRMVDAAMRQAGIGKDDEVAIIGHSQGGIVAATVAADLADKYNISHVVTAGSPVANHPIPAKTWVTSVEIGDEIVASLDGASNPNTDQWLTVRGHVSRTDDSLPTVADDGVCAPGAQAGSPSLLTGTPVKDAPERKEITHWLKYHQAAYDDALDQGSHAVTQHDRHFQEIIDGELIETHYYEGRMTPCPPKPNCSSTATNN